jgi:two-component system LytT family sensor kinase
MKKIILSLSFLFFALIANAQKNNYNGYKNSYPGIIGNFGFNMLFTVDEFTKTVDYLNSIANQPLNNLVYLEGTKEINLLGFINKDSLSFYRYNIVENDNKQIVSDATPNESNIKNLYQNRAQIDLGKFNVENKKLTINLYKITNRSEIVTIIIYNKRIQPASISMINLDIRDKKGGYVKFKSKEDAAVLNVDEATKNLMIVIKSTDLDFIYSVYLRNKVTRKIVFRSNDWLYGYITPRVPYLLINAEYFNKSGDYELLIIPKLSQGFGSKSIEKSTTRYSFHVNNNGEKYFSSRELLLISVIIGGFCGLISVLILNNRKKRAAKLIAKNSQEKEIAKLQLKSVRAQLNPHFLFNALAGIQNLMNKNEIDNANRYLTKFARLTRNVLDHKDLINLTSEKTLLDDYLQMEQLRFGFQYNIMASPDLDVENIEIPAMLLQPFVENAVKHGIAEKGNDGKIEIGFTKQGTDLILSVKDNGGGFDSAKDYSGLGLALTKNRISLLNSIYKETPFLLDIKANIEGTLVQITINEWL